MLLSRPDQMQLDQFLQQLKQIAGCELGYPVAFDLDYSALMPFLEISLNNAGDPFMPMTYQLNSHEFEREVITFFGAIGESITKFLRIVFVLESLLGGNVDSA